ncbi:small subunit ribosomal protein S9 [Acetobacteroides hydrogenigenes]|uniref:Small ribosomal subunit protein uS9 n=2 Tax=Acetobacteroides hydrogenigenes TaxID=979970 RepID=A0A4R2E429_9BACT|nr:small subunit ribosomal protein S9 [Acetobacteroides hydrogenigenes]
MSMEVVNTLGRRKAAVARIYMTPGKGEIVINNKPLEVYFTTGVLQYTATQALLLTNQLGKFDIKVNLDGGGVKGQAEALRLAISRALCEIDAENRSVLKANGLLTRDSRVVERKKPGQPKARKRFQFSKR